MANGDKNVYKNGKNNGNSNSNGNGNNGISQVEAGELSAEDYEIIAAALVALGEVFSLLSLLKAKQVTKESGGVIDVPELFTLSTRKTPRRKRR